MANSDKNIIITPNIGGTADPKIVFSGADATTAAQNITMVAYPTSAGTLSFEGSAGQLFSITNNLTGTIFSVNDISGIPSIEVDDDGTVRLAQFSGNVLIGTNTDDGTSALQVDGTIAATTINIGGATAATEAYVTTAISNLVDTAPATLDTLNELAAALGDDANFSTTVTNSIALKAPIASPIFTGKVSAGTGVGGGFRNATYTAGQNAVWSFGNSEAYGISYKQGAPDDMRIHFGNYAAPQHLFSSSGAYTSTGEHYVGSSRVFHDAYHPNADKWTTARTNTVTLTGDVTGTASASVDGTGNWTVSVPAVVANDSHTHSIYVLKAGDTMTGELIGQDFRPASGYHYRRSNHHTGHLEGSYNNVAANALKSNPIYTIGSSYNPIDAALSDMYGIGYSRGDASFLTSLTGSSNWGMYVASDGDARVWLDGSGGIIKSTGEHYVGSSRVFHDTYHPNADKWTTARTNTVTLTGDVTGTASASVDGTGNWTVSVPAVVANDSHTHSTYMPTSFQDAAVINFTVGGNADTYYPVSIQGGGTFAYQMYSISRNYAATAPSTWYTSTHKGGLTLTWQYSGDSFWGGNDHDIRIIKFDEIYSTMVTKMAGSVGGGGLHAGVVVWLRGGTASYTFHGPKGSQGSVNVHLTSVTGADSTVYAPMSYSSSDVASSINARYPVRGESDLYVSNNAVWHTGNDGSGSTLDADLLDGQQGSYYATASSIPSVGNGTLSITTSGSASGSGTFTANQSGNTTINISATDTNTVYTHPAYTARSINTSGAQVLDIFTSDAIGSVTNITTRTMTLAELGYTGATDANNYSFPYTVSMVEGANAIAQRNASGYLHASYFNGTGTFSTSGADSGMGRFTGTNGSDTYGRSYSATGARVLLNVENGATADQTAAEILTAIKTVDGSGSGLNADLLDSIDSTSFLRSDAADTFTGTLTMGTQLALVANNYGRGAFGIYSDTRYQHVWSMGTAYKTSDDGTSYGNMYGLTWTHTNIGTGANQSIAGLSHQLQLRENGVLKCAFGTGIWTAHTITSGAQGTLWGSSNDGSGSGLDADLLDGIDSSRFIYGDNATGKSTSVSSFQAQPSGFFFYSAATGAPTSEWYNWLTCRGSSWGNGGEYSFQLTNSFWNKKLYFQHVQTGSYQGWDEIWTSATDGSGSGLDADLLDGQDGTYYAPASSIGNGILTINTSGSASGGGTFTANQSGNTTITITGGTIPTNNNQLTNGSGYTTNTGTLTSSNDRVYISDTRGAARAPSYYDDRYAQWDFQNYADTGVGGDAWHALLTVSKWASYDPSHRQEQLIFSGDHLWRRTATSDAVWGTSKKIWDSGNDGSGSTLDADLLDGLELHTGRNNEANKVVRTEANGYCDFGWINTTSGVASGAPTRIYCSQDSYIRYYTPASLAPYLANVASAAEIYTTQTAGTAGVHYPTFVSVNASGNKSLKYDPGMMYDPSTNILGDVNFNFKGTLTGTASNASSLSGYNAEEGAVNNSIVKRDGDAMITAKKLYLNGGNYEGQIVFGATDSWRTGLRQHDDGDAELRIWAKNANGRVHIATGYDGQPVDIAKPTDGFVVDHNNVGIGDFSTTDPTEKLHVLGNMKLTGNLIGNDNSATFKANTVTSYGSWCTSGSRGGYDGIVFDGGGDTALMFDSGGNGGMYRQSGGGWYNYFHVGNNCMGINDSTTSSSYGAYLTGAFYATGNITAYSDRRVKENIVKIDNALEKVNKLEGVYYNRIDDESKTKEIGFIAQDVNEVVPELVTYAKDVDQYGVKYQNTTALLVEAVKELTQQVKDLKQEIEEIKKCQVKQ